MGGTITAGGLISGLDSNAIISQLLSLEAKPITRLQTQINGLKKQQTAVRNIRTQLLSLRNKAQDFRLNQVFNAYNADSSDKEVATASVTGSSPVLGSFALNVTKLASATTAVSNAKVGATINPAAALNSSGLSTTVDAGTFTINGVQFTVNPTTQSLNDIITAINGSSAGVTASYNAGTDTVSIRNTAASNTNVINFSAQGDTSNLLSALNLKSGTQYTNGFGSTQVDSTVNLGAVDAGDVLNTVSFANGALTSGSFSINGVSISIDPTTDTLQDVLSRINTSDANVSASYDSATDRIRFTSNTLGSRTISFGAGGDTSNFLSVTNLASATQVAGNDATFTVNGGPTLTRNTNEVNDAISGVTVKLLSLGTSSVTVTSDNDKIVTGVKSFVDEFNKTVQAIRDITSTGADLAGDAGIRNIEDYLRATVFNNVPGLTSDFSNLIDIGITTGNDFSATEAPKLSLDEEKFRKALQDDRDNVGRLFANDDKTGIADIFFSYLDDATQSTGFLNQRAKANGTIDLQIENLNDTIDRQNDRLKAYETRLRRQFLNLESLSANFQQQSSALSSARFGAF